jgi:hypothetical protein
MSKISPHSHTRHRPEMVKCWIGNLNGKHEGLVVARSQKEAAKVVGTSLHDFRDFWSEQRTPWPIEAPKVRTLYTRSYGSRASDPFKEGRT